jgi:hypothetical protein
MWRFGGGQGDYGGWYDVAILPRAGKLCGGWCGDDFGAGGATTVVTGVAILVQRGVTM